ncbi:hypothetical protein CCR75_004299 [Bremia lactucae]|uniref:Uncharacterized protein n=1 Tax=Bremia lactucae TaxID=4779 RepID=A0A976IIW8_BRELC|nr:hypothetical protein CCR75_004299 [Bremia lactucae]
MSTHYEWASGAAAGELPPPDCEPPDREVGEQRSQRMKIEALQAKSQPCIDNTESQSAASPEFADVLQPSWAGGTSLSMGISSNSAPIPSHAASLGQPVKMVRLQDKDTVLVELEKRLSPTWTITPAKLFPNAHDKVKADDELVPPETKSFFETARSCSNYMREYVSLVMLLTQHELLCHEGKSKFVQHLRSLKPISKHNQ